MVEISDKSHVRVNWRVTPYDYSGDLAENMRVAFARKYKIPKDNVNVVPDFIMPKDSGATTLAEGVTTENIQDPEFHKKLFLKYLEVNDIKDYDLDIIDTIDRDVNSKIDYHVCDSYRKFGVKWLRWSNFQSYGADNYFDFNSLEGLVLLNGEPANQSGKTTFAVDLLHFLFFGNSEKCDTLGELFNYTLPEETNVSVEGCISIDGEEYIIKRVLTRPALKNRTKNSKVTHKVEYYRVVGDSTEELSDYIDENGEDSRHTNKIIKECIGREDDFDLMMCITGSNLDSLIDEKPTERGRLLSRWIGLIPIEQKEDIAKEKFAQSVKPSLISNQYNKESLRDLVIAYNTEIGVCENSAKEHDWKRVSLEMEIASLEDELRKLSESKQSIDSSVLKIDITTLRHNLDEKMSKGVDNKKLIEHIDNRISEIGDVRFSVEEYDTLVEKRTSLMVEQQNLRNEAKTLMDTIKQLKTSEYCPTCGKKFDNVDNSAQIAAKQGILDVVVKNGKKVSSELEKIEKMIAEKKDDREKYIELSRINAQKASLEVANERLRSECLDLKATEKEYNKNSQAIDNNNRIGIEIRNTEANIKSKREARDYNMKKAEQYRLNIDEYKKEIKSKEEMIARIEEEEKLVYNWKLYLAMVGKNGISKMVMRNALPIINARMSQILDDVCDFEVKVDINNRNEVTFNISRNGVTKSLKTGSGFEKTTAAIALRSVLSDISTISKMNFIVLDEVLGRVASENYEKMHLLYDRISRGYDFVFQITHINDVKDWHKQIVTVVKSSDGVSALRFSQNNSMGVVGNKGRRKNKR